MIESFATIVLTELRGKHYEPVKSTRDRSVREMKLGPHHIRHRFEFDGAIGMDDLIMENVTSANSLMQKLLNDRLYGDDVET